MSVKKSINNDLNLNIIGFNNFLSDLLNDEFSNNIKTISAENADKRTKGFVVFNSSITVTHMS